MKNKYFSILSVLYLNQLYEKLKPGFEKDFVFQEIDYKKMYLPKNVSLYDSTQIMDSNPIKTAIVVCNKLIKEQVGAGQIRLDQASSQSRHLAGLRNNCQQTREGRVVPCQCVLHCWVLPHPSNRYQQS